MMHATAWVILVALVAAACATTDAGDAAETGDDANQGGSPAAVGGAQSQEGGVSGSMAGAIVGGAESGGSGLGGSGAGAGTGGSSAGGVAGLPSGGSAGDAGKGGAAPGGQPNAGAGGNGATPCEPGASRCGPNDREVCSATGEWLREGCPLGTPSCSNGSCVVRGPAMIKVTPYYVDSTEVTVAHYQEFLDAKQGDTSGQPAICSWNTNYDDVPLHNPDEFPMSNVDWCDARAYCEWADKHLCGSIGGGAVAFPDVLTVTSQWFRACGGPNSWSHPNNDPMCNSGTSTLEPVKSNPGCEGFYPGIFDMEGNAAEWVDGCDANTGPDDSCPLLGGSVYDNKSYCSEAYDEYKRNDRAPAFGFRCCSG